MKIQPFLDCLSWKTEAWVVLSQFVHDFELCIVFWVNTFILSTIDHNNIGHNHQQNSTAPEQIYPACPAFTKIH